MKAKTTLAAWVLLSSCAPAATIQVATLNGYIFENGAPVATLSTASPTYQSTLDANNFGAFSWSFVNNTLSALNNLSFIVFLDADLDRDDNTFFNEYGEFISLALPPGAPGGAIVASSWEIDEPGFLFGNILNNVLADLLDETNGVPSSAPDDVSLALRFTVPTLAPGETLNARFILAALDIGGLRQVDPDSLNSFYLNGYMTVDPASTGSGVPEPATVSLLSVAAIGWYLKKRRE